MEITITQDNLKEYPLHKHETHEIVCYLFGRGIMQTDEGNIPFDKGTIIILPPNLNHRSISENEFKNICVHVCEPVITNRKILVGYDNSFGDTQALAQMLMRSYIDRLVGQESQLAYLYVAYREMVLSLTNKNKYDKADLVREEIVSNCNNTEYSVDLALHNKGVSSDHLRVVFKKKYGCSPIQYLTKLRISNACNLFEVYGEKIKINEVAYASGYNDELYFSRIFKKNIGKSPKEYRKYIKK